MKNQLQKDKIRQDIALRKKGYSLLQLGEMSDEVFSVLEITGVFQESHNIFIYNSMKDEVVTMPFINKWCEQKNFFLPVVIDDDLVFKAYHKDTEFVTSQYGIKEPKGNVFADYKKVDMIIVPGVAFDRKCNRLGRGGGYYDRFLPDLTNTKKVGVCFDFQLLDSVPANEKDIKMDMIVSENELIW